MTEPTVIEQLKWSKDDYSNIDTPFAGDHWGREQFAKHLTGYVQRMKVGATIAIDAEWGAGKTWFVQHWKQHLIKEGHDVAYIDAFANDHIDDPFLLIATEIANQVGKQGGADLRSKAEDLWHYMLPILPKLIFAGASTLMGYGLLAQCVSDLIKATTEGAGDFGKALTESVQERVKEKLEEQVKNHEADKQTLDAFKNQLRTVAGELNKPLVFIIDELDRCKPEFSIRLIERIKHFFDIPNIVFVLAIHKKQLCESIDSYYGFKSENQYLEKFIDFSFKLSAESDIDLDFGKQLTATIKNLGLVEETEIHLSNLFFLCRFLCKKTKPTPRQLKFILNKYSLLFITGHSNSAKNDILLMCLFFKETGKESEIIDFKFLDSVVKEIIYYSPESTTTGELEPRRLSFEIRETLVRNASEYGIYGNLAEMLTAFSSIAGYVDNKSRQEAKKSAAHSFLPDESRNSNKALDQAWLDYIQRGTL